MYFNSHAHVERDFSFLVTKNSLDKFQLTRSRGAWLAIHYILYAYILFQLTRSRGAWRNHSISEQTQWWFQLTRSRGAWLNPVSEFLGYKKFQLTRSRGAWPNCTYLQTTFHVFQLTRSRGAWLSTTSCGHFEYIISTHTLTWSVTAELAEMQNKLKISTHTLTWSVTSGTTAGRSTVLFQLTRSRGAWHFHTLNTKGGTYISTHTLTWSVTYVCGNGAWKCGISTHTLTWSVTLNDFMRSFWVYNFNSHAHVERDCGISWNAK